MQTPIERVFRRMAYACNACPHAAEKPSLLMLDEPTNHLDLPSIQWLEKYLQDYDGTFILVSHDRYFLDRTINMIAEVANEK